MNASAFCLHACMLLAAENNLSLSSTVDDALMPYSSTKALRTVEDITEHEQELAGDQARSKSGLEAGDTALPM